MRYLCLVAFSCFCIISVTSQTPCVTPNGEKATCMELRFCPMLIQAYFSEDRSMHRFLTLSASICSSSQDQIFPICCGTSSNFTQVSQRVEPKVNPTASKRNLLPSKIYCGLQHYDDYFHENDTNVAVAVDEFPWLLALYHDEQIVKGSGSSQRQKRSENSSEESYFSSGLIAPARISPALPEKTTSCLGVLINNRYVLTAASCASENRMWVALGQHDQKRNVSCTKTQFGDDCTHPVINVTVTEQIFSPAKSLLLLRLESIVDFTDYVRPICLPLDESERPIRGNTVITSGWGRSYDVKDLNKSVKKKNTQKVAILRDCSDQSDICLLQDDYEAYTCAADRGGPMMYRYKENNWILVGIVDYITSSCSYFTVPGKKLTPDLVEWIIDTLRA